MEVDGLFATSKNIVGNKSSYRYSNTHSGEFGTHSFGQIELHADTTSKHRWAHEQKAQDTNVVLNNVKKWEIFELTISVQGCMVPNLVVLLPCSWALPQEEGELE